MFTRRKKTTRGLVVIDHDPEKRHVYFCADEATAKAAGQYGKLTAHYQSHTTGDLHWILGVSRLHRFSHVLNELEPERLDAEMARLFQHTN